MRFTGNGITNCYPDQVEDFISITVLSVDKSRDRIVEDLTQLLLGPEAAKALDRFGRVAGQLAEAKKKLEADITMRDSRRSEATARRVRLFFIDCYLAHS